MAVKPLLPAVLGAASLSLLPAALAAAEKKPSVDVPPVAREFRGVWVATVANIDWPSKPGLPVDQQKAELLALLDRSVQLKLNAIVFQVRPACDALYDSKLEPWSEFLTGVMGQAPSPYYDPLAFAVEEAHKRGLELHAWFNPYRAHHFVGKSPISDSHVSRTKPDMVRQYGQYMWLDPGVPEVRRYSLSVVRDVVRRYDVDGVHIDDYFYPYKEKDASGNVIPFPDDPSWTNYVTHGGTLNRDDWRRENVNLFVKELYKTVKAEKPHVKVGISPFGIWRPGNPATIQGFDAYQEIYADSLLWWKNGWADYFTPQLYWKIDPPAQSYPVLLKWWTSQNDKGRNLWAGNYTGRFSERENGWPAEEIVRQIRLTREQPGATGNVHFSAKVFMREDSPLNKALQSGVYAAPALVPASPWLDKKAPGQPKVMLQGAGSSATLQWKPGGGEKVWQWVIQRRAGGQWTTEIVPGDQSNRPVSAGAGAPDVVAVSAVDRLGNQSKPVVVELAGAR